MKRYSLVLFALFLASPGFAATACKFDDKAATLELEKLRAPATADNKKFLLERARHQCQFTQAIKNAKASCIATRSAVVSSKAFEKCFFTALNRDSRVKVRDASDAILLQSAIVSVTARGKKRAPSAANPMHNDESFAAMLSKSLDKVDLRQGAPRDPALLNQQCRFLAGFIKKEKNMFRSALSRKVSKTSRERLIASYRQVKNLRAQAKQLCDGG